MQGLTGLRHPAASNNEAMDLQHYKICAQQQHGIRAFVWSFNSLTPKSILAGRKNSRSEDFWQAKHKGTNIPTMMEPFPPPAAWFLWTSVHHPREPTQKGLDKTAVKGFSIKLQIK